MTSSPFKLISTMPSFGRIVSSVAVLLLCGCGFWYIVVQLRKPLIEHSTLVINGEKRLYRLVTPQGLRPDKPHPVLFALHGALDEVDHWAAGSGLDDLAVAKRFLLVYPQGWLLNWPPSIPEENPEVVERELRFFDALCEELVQKHGADRDRIYVAGSSQGGAMVNILAAKRSELIAAAVCNCGWLPRPLGETPLGTEHKCPILYVVGADDRQVPPDAVREGHDVFAKNGHPTQWLLVPNHGHGWPRGKEFEDMLWSFLSSKRLNEVGER